MLTFFCFVIFLLEYSSLSLYFQRWTHTYLHNILSRLMGISALKPALRNIGNSRRNRRKTVEILRKEIKVNIEQKTI